MPNLSRLTCCLLFVLVALHTRGQQPADSSATPLTVKLGASEFNRGIQVNPVGLMQGRAPGLWVIGSGSEPTRRYDTYFRGIGSFAGERQPLYVVDGVPGVDPALVTPADIAQIRVLTDPASLARYGARSANGVIEIETRRLTSGAFSFHYEAQGGVQYRTKAVDMLSAAEYRAQLRPAWQRFDQGGNTDWQEAISRTAFQQNHYLSGAGQYGKLRINGSFNVLNAPGVIQHNALNRLSGRITVSGPVDQALFWQVSALGRHENELPLDAEALNMTLNGIPTIPVYQPDGSFSPNSSFDTGNPVSRLAQVEQTNKIRQGQFQAYARHRLNNQFSVDGRFAHTRANTRFVYDDRNYTIQGATEYGRLRSHSEDFIELNLRFAEVRTRSEARASLGVGMQQAATDRITDQTGQPVSATRTTWRLWSALAQGEWGGLNRQLWLRGTVRADGATRFGSDQWTINPGVTAEWHVLRVKPATHDDNPAPVSPGSPAQSVVLFAGVSLAANTQTFLKPIDAPLDPNLKPETQRLMTVGIRATSPNGRWSGQFAVFDRLTNNAYWITPNILNAPLTNLGQLRNAGTNWHLKGQLVQVGRFRWTAGVVGSYLYNRVEDFGAAGYRVSYAPVSGRGLTGVNSQLLRAGLPLFSFYGPIFAGVSNAGRYNLLDRNGDRRISPDGDWTVLGVALPRWQVGLQSDITVGNWQLSGLVDGLSGHSLLNATELNVANLNRLPINNISQDALKTSLSEAPLFTSQYIQQGYFLRLNFVTLAYRLTIAQNHSLTINGTLQNVLLRTGYGGPDPEAALAATPFGHGTSSLAPNAATASIGVRFNW